MYARTGQYSGMTLQKSWLTKMKKAKLGIVSFTSCQGCQWVFLDMEFVEIMRHFEFADFPLLKEEKYKGMLDIVFVEGCITKKEQEKELARIRQRAKFLVAFGTCATFGGIPTIKNFLDVKNETEEPFQNPAVLKQIAAMGIDSNVKVDYFLRGCPPEKEEIAQVLKNFLAGKKPKQTTFPVCVECMKKGNACLLQEGKPCMGPITHAGCDALCPSISIACYGCRGPLDDANVAAEVRLFKKHGIKIRDIKRYFRTFAGTSKVFKDVGKLK